MPYVYTAIILIVHIPVVIIRVVRWETVQTWCLVTTFFTITLTVQSYISTKFAADKVLTWTPLVLVIDAGRYVSRSPVTLDSVGANWRFAACHKSYSSSWTSLSFCLDCGVLSHTLSLTPCSREYLRNSRVESHRVCGIRHLKAQTMLIRSLRCK